MLLRGTLSRGARPAYLTLLPGGPGSAAGPYRSLATSSSQLRDRYGLWIGGEELPSENGETIAVENPLDGSVLTHVSSGAEADIAKAVAVAKEAFEDRRWSGVQRAPLSQI